MRVEISHNKLATIILTYKYTEKHRQKRAGEDNNGSKNPTARVCMCVVIHMLTQRFSFFFYS